MLLWSVQPQIAYSSFKKKKLLKGDWRRVEKSFVPPYKWMEKQMIKRGMMKKPQAYMWAWHTYLDKQKMPDFRCESYKSQLNYHKTLYRIAMEVPDDKVLLSDYEAWHNVLNGFYYTVNEREWNKIYPKENKLKPRFLGQKNWIYCGTKTIKEVEKSWERIFNLKPQSLKGYDPAWMGECPSTIQACVPQFEWQWVRKVEKFKHNSRSSVVFVR